MKPGAAEKQPTRNFKVAECFLAAEFVVETLKVNAVPTTHEELDGVLAAFMHDDFGKVKLKTELLRVAGKKACRRAMLALRPQIEQCFTSPGGDLILGQH